MATPPPPPCPPPKGEGNVSADGEEVTCNAVGTPSRKVSSITAALAGAVSTDEGQRNASSDLKGEGNVSADGEEVTCNAVGTPSRKVSSITAALAGAVSTDEVQRNASSGGLRRASSRTPASMDRPHRFSSTLYGDSGLTSMGRLCARA